jgi:transposase-like protein
MSVGNRLICPHCQHVGITKHPLRDGARVRCSKCSQTFHVALSDSGSPNEAYTQEMTDESAPSPPWYKDRTLQIGLSIPALILLAFAAYLGLQTYRSHERAK